MTRSVLRFVSHTIRHAPEGGVLYEAFCATKPGEGEETSGPQDDQDAVQLWCLRHTGRTGHDLFRRVVTDHARVTRNERSRPGERDRARPVSHTWDGTLNPGGDHMLDRWLTMADGNPQDDSDSGNEHGGGGSDEGGNTDDGQGPADGR